MRNQLTSFVQDFKKRKGVSVLSSGLLIKVMSFLLSIYVVRLLPEVEYGYLAFSMSIIGILSAFAGAGMNWSLLRFGALLTSQIGKYRMFQHAIKKGNLINPFLLIAIIAVSFFLPENVSGAQYFLIALSLTLVTNYLLNLLKSYFRIINRNKIFSLVNVFSSISLFILAFVLALSFGTWGYVAALVLAPLITFFYFYYKVVPKNTSNIPLNLPNKFISYGIYTGIGMIANQALLNLGPVLAGVLEVPPEEIAAFKVSTIIPMNLLFIPSLILTTDFVHLSKLYKEPKQLFAYYFKYVLTIGLLITVPFALTIFFDQEIITLLFGEKYISAAPMFSALMVGVCFSFLFRVPLGNMLSAIGKAGWNVVHSIFWIIVFVPLCYLLFSRYGLIGISYSISIVFILSGFASLLLLWYYKKINS